MLYRPLGAIAGAGYRVARGCVVRFLPLKKALRLCFKRAKTSKSRFFHEVFGVLYFQKLPPTRPLEWILLPRTCFLQGVSLWKQADRKKDRKKTAFFLDIGCIGFYICTPKTEVMGIRNGKRFRKKSCKSICQIKKEFYFCTR